VANVSGRPWRAPEGWRFDTRRVTLRVRVRPNDWRPPKKFGGRSPPRARFDGETGMDGFQGKTALVTGAAGGIGSMVCEALIESGRRAVLHDLPTSDGAAKARALAQRFGEGRAIFASGDLGDLPRLKRDAEKLAAELHGFDFLVNNAAIDPVAPIEAYSLDEFLAV